MDFKYKRLPIICHYCGILGHDLKHYATHYAMEKNGGSVEYQYGDFLRATGGGAGTLASQYTSNKSSSAEGSGSMKLFDPMVHCMRKMAVTREENLGNPREEDKDDIVNSGSETGIMHTGWVDHANVKEIDSEVVCSSPIIMPTLKGNDESNAGFEEELFMSNLEVVQAEYRADGLHDNLLSAVDKLTDESGPSTSRPKTTWIRINRMDFGLSGLARAITLPSLGKKDTRETNSG